MEGLTASVHPPRARVLERAHALPADAWLGIFAVVAAGVHWAVSFWHPVQHFVPDEYLYTELARSLAHGSLAVRGVHTTFPSLLQPVVTAPLWAAFDTGVAYPLVKLLNAVVMGASVFPLYLLARRAGLSKRTGLVCAGLGGLSPNLYWATLVLSNPLSYTLALFALVAGFDVLVEATRRRQLVFVGVAALTALTSVQFIVLPAVLVAAALLVERFHVTRVVRRLWPTLALCGAAAVALASDRSVLGIYGNAHTLALHHGPGDYLHWLGANALVLAYAAGLCFVPGAVAGVAAALWRPRAREEAVLAALIVTTTLALLMEAAPVEMLTLDLEERYLAIITPLVPLAFALWVHRRFPLRALALSAAAALLLLSARVPVAPYGTGRLKEASPFLLGNAFLELKVHTPALVLSLVGGALVLLGALPAWRMTRSTAVAVVAAGALWLVAVASAGAAYDRHVAHNVALPADLSWIDHSGARHVAFVDTFGAAPYPALVAFMWNPHALDRELLLGRASGIDTYPAGRLAVSPGGRLLEGGRPLGTPFVMDTTGIVADLTGVRRAAATGATVLFVPRSTPRLHLLGEGFWRNGLLDANARLVVWPRRRETLRIPLAAPPGAARMVLSVRTGRGPARTIVIEPGSARTLRLPLPAEGRYVVRILTLRGALWSARDQRFYGPLAGTPTAR